MKASRTHNNEDTSPHRLSGVQLSRRDRRISSENSGSGPRKSTGARMKFFWRNLLALSGASLLLAGFGPQVASVSASSAGRSGIAVCQGAEQLPHPFADVVLNDPAARLSKVTLNLSTQELRAEFDLAQVSSASPAVQATQVHVRLYTDTGKALALVTASSNGVYLQEFVSKKSGEPRLVPTARFQIAANAIGFRISRAVLPRLPTGTRWQADTVTTEVAPDKSVSGESWSCPSGAARRERDGKRFRVSDLLKLPVGTQR